MTNIAQILTTTAARLPDKCAVRVLTARDRAGRPAEITFQQLDQLSGEYAQALAHYGITRGAKTLLMVKPSLDFFALTFALFKLGAPPVMIDPGMGISRLLHCVQQAAPTALVGIPAAHLLRFFRPRFFAGVKHYVTVGRKLFWRGAALRELAAAPTIKNNPLAPIDPAPDELAAILFTTGSTGPAKGVEYTHPIFLRQCTMIREIYGVTDQDIDLACYPLFALFSVGIGMTAVIPEMNPTRPAAVDPRKIIEAVNTHGCTFSFGSPALWRKVSDYGVAHQVKLPSLRQVLMSGCPVPPRTHENLLRHLLADGAETHAPYGATESLPVCDLTGSVVLAEAAAKTAQGLGYCVGAPVNGIDLKIIRWVDGVIKNIADAEVLPLGEIGEIIVRGANVTRAYHLLPDATARAKIADGAAVWHRIGDLGYLDEGGRVWFCGRAAHRVVTSDGILYSVNCEAIFNAHPQVKRAALVGLGESPHQTPLIVIEPLTALSGAARRVLEKELAALAATHALTKTIMRFAFQKSLPVDIRHNAKINREALRWRYNGRGE